MASSNLFLHIVVHSLWMNGFLSRVHFAAARATETSQARGSRHGRTVTCRPYEWVRWAATAGDHSAGVETKERPARVEPVDDHVGAPTRCQPVGSDEAQMDHPVDTVAVRVP